MACSWAGQCVRRIAVLLRRLSALGKVTTMTTTHETPSTGGALTADELKADLTLEQLKQLVGLVEYDASQRPVPGDRDGRRRVRGRQRDPDRALLPARARHGPRGVRRPRDRAAATASPTSCAPAAPASSSPAGSPPTAPCSTTTAGTATASSTSRSRCPTSTSASTTRARWAPTILDEPHDVTDENGTVRIGRDRDVRRDPPHPGRPLALHGPYLPGYVADATKVGAARGPPEAAVPGRRPLRRQRRARPDGRVGRVLQQGHGLHEHGRVHRRRHRHRLLRADVEGGGERQPPGEVPAQRAGDRARRSRRSTSTSSSTTGPAASTSRWPPATSCAPSTCCAPTASSSSTPPTRTTTTPSCGSGSVRCGCRSRS